MRPIAHLLLALATVALGCDGPDYSTGSSRGADGAEDPPPEEEAPPAEEEEMPPVAADAGAPEEMDEEGEDDYPDTEDLEGEELTEQWTERLSEREVDYGAALRIASLRLRGVLPTLLEVRFVADAADPRMAYERLVEGFLDDPRFVRQTLSYWRDTFKMGGTTTLDTAPVLATQLTVEDRDLTELFTAPSGNCPTYDPETDVITPGDCDNGVTTHAGVLTNPGVMAHFDSNLAFRRVRWVQETFDCTAFPAEHGEPVDVGGDSPYTSPWPFDSIAGAATGGRIDFRDTSSVICANCHATMNHLAPLFGYFDSEGQWSDELAVTLPSDGSPTAEMSDWLPAGQRTAWRFGVPAESLPALGSAMATDPDVARCFVARAWNYALGKGDIVLTLSVVPDEVIQDLVDDFVAGGHRYRDLLLQIFTSEDFVRF